MVHLRVQKICLCKGCGRFPAQMVESEIHYPLANPSFVTYRSVVGCVRCDYYVNVYLPRKNESLTAAYHMWNKLYGKAP